MSEADGSSNIYEWQENMNTSSSKIPENRELSPLAALTAIILCILFGANAVAIKVGLAEIGVFSSAGFRFGIASVVIVCWAVITRRSFHIKRDQIPQIIFLSLIFTAQISMMYLGLKKSNASRGTLIMNVQPFFVLFLAHFFIPGDRIAVRKLIGIIFGFSGVFFVFLEKKGTTSGFRSGDIMILISAFLWACNMVYTKLIIAGFKPFQIALYPMIISTPIFFLEGLLWDKVIIPGWSLNVLGSLAYQSLVAASFGYVVWSTLLRRYGAVTLHTFVFIVPVSGVIFGGLLLGEPITYKILLALLLVVCGLLTAHLRQEKFPPIFPLGRNV